jgi:hypothetical protein
MWAPRMWWSPQLGCAERACCGSGLTLQHWRIAHSELQGEEGLLVLRYCAAALLLKSRRSRAEVAACRRSRGRRTNPSPGCSTRPCSKSRLVNRTCVTRASRQVDCRVLLVCCGHLEVLQQWTRRSRGLDPAAWLRSARQPRLRSLRLAAPNCCRRRRAAWRSPAAHLSSASSPRGAPDDGASASAEAPSPLCLASGACEDEGVGGPPPS